MNSSIISATELHTLLPEKPVILDCRFALQDVQLGRQQYLQDHIPGAYYCDLNQHLSGPQQKHGGRHPLPDPEVFAATLSGWGVTRFSQVVVYDDSRMAFAARAWWLLRAMGVMDVSILNGGYSAWRAAGYEHDRRVPAPRLGNIRPSHMGISTTGTGSWPDTVAYATVKNFSEQDSAVLIDSREEPRYLGAEEPIDPIAGHIPGAINKPWQQVTDSQGFVLPVAAQEQRWANISGSESLVVYCGSGVTACVNLLSLHIAGRDDVLLYPGSWSDWCSHTDAAIATGPQKISADIFE